MACRWTACLLPFERSGHRGSCRSAGLTVQALRYILQRACYGSDGCLSNMQVTTVGSIVSIAFFNFFGLSVTKSLSGAARATIDASRTLLIWLFSIQIGWERFHFLQVQSPLNNTVLAACHPCCRYTWLHFQPLTAACRCWDSWCWCQAPHCTTS